MIRTLAGFFLLSAICFATSAQQKGFAFADQSDSKKLELLYNGKLVTAYCYFDSTEKPVLFPLKSLSGITITRGYPIAPRAGERTDHPHHVGLWLNYESVNGLDFWNNSSVIAPEKKPLYGSIKHKQIISSKASGDRAELETLSQWIDHSGKVLLEEITSFAFSAQGENFIIDRSAVLKAVADEVLFKDIKDGMLGLRVARQLEMPSKQQDQFVDAQGNVTEVKKMDNDGVTGMYVNREGVQGDATWAKRSIWTVLNGQKDGVAVSIAMIDHPSNVGYPTYWHARGYGLFAANPLGQKIFSDGKEELNFRLIKGKQAEFKYRVVIHAGKEVLNSKQIDQLAESFAKRK
ncbi:MAG: PmoA family protein [Bacteroidota bacterium]